MAVVMVSHPSRARSIIFRLENAPELQAQEVMPEEFKAASILHLNGRHWNACLTAARFERQQQAKVPFNGGAYRYRPGAKWFLSNCIDPCQTSLKIRRKQFIGQIPQLLRVIRRHLQAGQGLKLFH